MRCSVCCQAVPLQFSYSFLIADRLSAISFDASGFKEEKKYLVLRDFVEKTEITARIACSLSTLEILSESNISDGKPRQRVSRKIYFPFGHEKNRKNDVLSIRMAKTTARSRDHVHLFRLRYQPVNLRFSSWRSTPSTWRPSHRTYSSRHQGA